MRVTRSAFARKAARSAHSLPALPRGNPSWIAAASLRRRSTRWAWVPSLLWYTMLASCQARADHALVALHDRRRVVELHVGHDHEAGQELALLVQQRKVFLVLLHGEDQAFLRNREEFLVERAEIHL